MDRGGSFGIRSAITVALAGALVAFGCNSEEGTETAEPCQQGRSVACTCPGGGEGGQVCQADGTWGPCRCDGDVGLEDTGSDPSDTSEGGSDAETDTDLDPRDTDTGGDGVEAPPAFEWDQTHVDTGWLETADANDNLTVETVTNLDADGEGSLEAALQAARDNANTLIVFEVGGVIDYGGTTYIRSKGDNVYIAGQTAPYPGITLVRTGIRIEGDNTIVEHVTFLPGDDIDDPHKSRSITYDDVASHIMVDHCTAGWAPDTNVNFRKNHSNLAFINGINTEALNDSSHPEAPHGYGTIISENTTGIAVIGNLNSHNWKRNPFNNEDDSEFVWLNNYTYDWGKVHFHGTGSNGPSFDWIGNVSRAGPSTNFDEEGMFASHAATVYWENNRLIPEDIPLVDDDITYADEPRHLPSGLSESDLLDPNDLEEFILARVGPRPADRDPFNARIIENFKNREGGIIDHQDDRGGYPDYSTQTRELAPPDTNVLDWLKQYTAQVE